MNSFKRPIIGLIIQDIKDGFTLRNLEDILNALLGGNTLDIVDLTNKPMSVDTIIYIGKFKRIYSLNEIKRYQQIPILVNSISRNDEEKWKRYFKESQRKSGVVWGIVDNFEMLEKDIHQVENIDHQDLHKYLGFWNLKSKLIELLKERSLQLGGNWYAPRFEIQKKLLKSLQSAVEEIVMKFNIDSRSLNLSNDEYKLYQMRKGLIIVNPAEIKIFNRLSMRTGKEIFSLVVPIQIRTKDAYTFLFAESGRNYDKISTYLTGILHGLLNSEIDLPYKNKIGIKTSYYEGFVCRISCLPPYSDKVFTEFIKPTDVFLDVQISPTLSEFDAPIADNPIKVKTNFYRLVNLLGDKSLGYKYVNNKKVGEFESSIKHWTKPDPIPVQLAEITFQLLRVIKKDSNVALLFTKNGLISKMASRVQNQNIYEFSSDEIWKSIEQNAFLDIFTRENLISNYELIVADPALHRTIDFLLANLKVKSNNKIDKEFKYYSTGELVVQRIKRGCGIFVVFGGNLGEPRILEFIKEILKSNFEINYEFVSNEDVIFLSGALTKEKIILKTLKSIKKSEIFINTNQINNSCYFNKIKKGKIVPDQEKGTVIIISGPNGAGRDTIINHLKKQYDEYIGLAHQYVSRQLRPDEQYRSDIHEVNITFGIDNNASILTPLIFENSLYAISKNSIKEMIDTGTSCIVKANIKGIDDIKKFCKENSYHFRSICILADQNILDSRLKIFSYIFQDMQKEKIDQLDEYLEEKLQIKFDEKFWNIGSKKEFINEVTTYLIERDVLPENKGTESKYGKSISYSKSSAFIHFPKYTDEKDILTKEIVRIIKNTTIKIKRYLDIGAGSGEILIKVANKLDINELVAVEPSQFNFNILQERVHKFKLDKGIEKNIQIIHELWENATDKLYGKFDLITLSHVYFPTDMDMIRKSFKKVYDFLSDSGILIVIIHSLNSKYIEVQKKIYEILGGKYLYKSLEDRNPSADDYKSCLTKIGFKIIDQTNCNSRFNFNFPCEREDIFKPLFLSYSAVCRFYMSFYLDEIAQSDNDLNEIKLKKLYNFFRENAEISKNEEFKFSITSEHCFLVLKK